MIEVSIDQASGFCFGVTTAIKKAEDALSEHHQLYCLGDIVHNSEEVDRLHRLGMDTITHEQLASLHNARVLLRAHGEPPTTYAVAHRNNIDIVDATCPVVLQLQKRVKECYNLYGDAIQIVIYGKKGHAEVNGLVGQTDGTAIVIEDVDGLNVIDFSKDIALFSQTTKSIEGFSLMRSEILSRLKDGARLQSYDTICRQVANRVDKLKEFAARHDLILFVSGAKSSNGKVLYNECKSVNANIRMIASPADVDKSWLRDIATVGVCGATSTPRWLMEQVRGTVLDYDK